MHFGCSDAFNGPDIPFKFVFHKETLREQKKKRIKMRYDVILINFPSKCSYFRTLAIAAHGGMRYSCVGCMETQMH